MIRRINQSGLDLIKYYEGLRLVAYKDLIGKWTIGYGHTETTHEGQSISESRATELLMKDIERFEKGVEKLLTGPSINDNQFSSLVSFAYNLGLSNLGSSTLLKIVNHGNYPAAANEFIKWCKAGGKEIPGLLARRRAERDLFLKC